MSTILLRYGEVALKSRSIRSLFEKQLIHHISAAFLEKRIQSFVERQWGRILIRIEDKDKEKTEGILKSTFGVVSFSYAKETTDAVDDIRKLCFLEMKERLNSELFHARIGSSPTQKVRFRITVSRTGSHPYSSMELAAALGEAMLKEFSGILEVSLKQPEVNIEVEVRNKQAFVFSERLPGPGGMPIGTQGWVLSFVDSRNALGALYMMLKRGCSAIVIGDKGIKDDIIAFLERYYPQGRKRLVLEEDLYRKARDIHYIKDSIRPLVSDAASSGKRKVSVNKKSPVLLGLTFGWDVSTIDENREFLLSLKEILNLPVFFPTAFIPKEIKEEVFLLSSVNE